MNKDFFRFRLIAYTVVLLELFGLVLQWREITKLREAKQLDGEMVTEWRAIRKLQAAVSHQKPPAPAVHVIKTSSVPFARRVRSSLVELKVKDSPEFQRVATLLQISDIEVRYGGLLRTLNLDPQRRAELLKLLLGGITAPEDINDAFSKLAATTPSLSPTDRRAAENAAIAEYAKQFQDGLQNLLGPDGYRQYREYEANLPQYLLVNELQQRLSADQVPLSSAQASALESAVRSHGDSTAYLKYSLIARPIIDHADQISINGYAAVPVTSTYFSISPSGEIFSTVPVTSSDLKAAAGILNSSQMVALQKIAAEQFAARQLATDYEP